MKNLDKDSLGRFIGLNENNELMFEFQNKVDFYMDKPISYSIAICIQEDINLYRKLIHGMKEYSLNQLKEMTNVFDNEIHWDSWIVNKIRYVR